MEVVTDTGRSSRPDSPTVVTIGAYDGVHLGHRVLLDEVKRRAADQGLRTGVITFDRHPATVVRPDSAPRLLTDLDQRLELLAAAGIDHTVVVTFDEQRAREPAEHFVKEIVSGWMAARLVVVGEDFHFGHERRGNVTLLREMGADLGFDVVGMGLLAEGGEVVSSTRIRKLLDEGGVSEASTLLGRPHEVRGIVEGGDGRGGGVLGFPTANVTVPRGIEVPADGIYAGYAEIGGSGPRAAAVYVGWSPTFRQRPAPSKLEAYLLDFSGDFYGAAARVTFVARLRSDRRFESAADLAEQMSRDVEATRGVLGGGALNPRARGRAGA